MGFRLSYCIVSVLAPSDKKQVIRDELEHPLRRYLERFETQRL